MSNLYKSRDALGLADLARRSIGSNKHENNTNYRKTNLSPAKTIFNKDLFHIAKKLAAIWFPYSADRDNMYLFLE